MPTTMQTATLTYKSTPWQDSVTLAQIDPALGIVSIGLSLTGTVFEAAAVQSTEAAPSMLLVNGQAGVTVAQPDQEIALVATPQAGFLIPLAASIGGTPVDMAASASASMTASATYVPGGTPTSAGAFLVGTGTVQLPVAATARVSAVGPGNFDAQFTTAVAALVAITATTGSGGTDPGALGVVDQLGSVGLPPISPVAPITGSITQQRTIAEAPTGWTDTLAFDGFDSSLGTLEGITITVRADSAGFAAAENLEPAGGAVTFGQVATVEALRSDGSIYAEDSSTRSLAAQLGAYDGAADFTGASGVSAATSLVPTFRPQSIVLDTSAADLAYFTQAAAVSLAVASHGRTTIAGPGNLDVVSSLQAGATVSLTYDYTAAPVAAPPFTAANTTLVVAPNQSAAGVQGFGPGDVIDAAGIGFDGATKATLANNTLTLTGSDGSTTIGFAAGSNLTASELHLARDASGAGTSITVDPTSLSLVGGADASSDYVGPVAGLQNQYIALNAQNVAAAATTDNWFLHGSTGGDALVAHGGRNVLDGGGGSDLLVGGTGQDTFFVDVAPGALAWSTIVGAHAGDDATMFGVAPGQAITWRDGLGAAGLTGLTGTVTDAAGGAANLTLSGFTTADLADGRISVDRGQVGSIPYLHVSINS